MVKLIFVIVVLGLVSRSQAFPRLLKISPGRIIGGAAAGPGELPYQISLKYYGSHVCGGAILTRDVIVTAAHCATIGAASGYSIVAGDRDRNINEGTEQETSIYRVVVHEDYDAWVFANDIALMFLNSPLNISNNVQPIQLPIPGHTAKGNAVVSGWGITAVGGTTANVLQKLTLPIVLDDDCRKGYGEEEILDSMICAGFPEGGRDSCQGDSGGPLAATDLGYRYLAGIISWGYGCARPGFPGVYTEVSHFVGWINRYI